jgi:hypothetical protein
MIHRPLVGVIAKAGRGPANEKKRAGPKGLVGAWLAQEHRTLADAVEIQAAAWERLPRQPQMLHCLPFLMRSTTSSTVRRFSMREMLVGWVRARLFNIAHNC